MSIKQAFPVIAATLVGVLAAIVYLMTPVANGFEFVRKMREREASDAIPIVVVTAKEITDADRQRLKGGVVGLIQKSGLEGESLLARLRERIDVA